ncbi:MAG: NAD(P)-dependent alcohol dehydrogenase [Verrucomicrobiae bacterium]|nr:NAD(P)-dependent alcohol dehydrogenase [Verrucomicrobiae bacterium]
MNIRAYAASAAREPLSLIDFDPGELGSDEVEIDVAYCGLCHSDLSMWGNDWMQSRYPFVPGHEVVGTLAAKGESVTHLELGQKVGLGWYSRSCGVCDECLSGNHNLCSHVGQTIVGRHGGFAEKVRAQALWATPLPEALDIASAGPLFCGGITVFNPILECGVLPTDRVGVVGIGGLGHMALQFLNKWGCDVTAFSSSPEKEEAARGFGAHHYVSSRDSEAIRKLESTLDLILVTVNVELDWEAYLAALKPKGRLHIVGAAPKVECAVSTLLEKQRSISGSPLGSPATVNQMLEFCGRHGIAPKTEIMPMSEANRAFERLSSEKPAHRLVLRADFD